MVPPDEMKEKEKEERFLRRRRAFKELLAEGQRN